jgi:hypothetical protein
VGLFSRLEGGLDSAFDRAAGAVFRGPIEPAQIAKRAEKQMNREKLIGPGKQHAPTLYTVLVNPDDNRKLFGFYPTMAAEIETYLMGKGTQNGLQFDGRPLVRFIVDDKLKSGKFDVIAENVAAPLIAQLRDEELEFYGLKEPSEPAPPEQDDAWGVAKRAGGEDVRDPLSPRAPGAYEGALAGGPGAGAALGANESPSANMRARIPTLEAPSAATGQARLFDLNAGKSYALIRSNVIIGRDAGCDIVLDDANISRQHAQLTQDVIGTWKISDLNSTNGTRLNGNLVGGALLRDGDEITIGVTVLEFRGAGAGL